MKTQIVIFVLFFVAFASCMKWRGYDEDGKSVIRKFTVLKAPKDGNHHTVEWRAVQIDKDGKLGKKRTLDAIQFTFSTAVIPHYTIRHFTQDADSVEKRAARHALRKLVEYEDTNNDGFDPDTDTIVQNYTLWDQTWSDLSRDDTKGDDDSNIVTVCSHTMDNVVELCIYFTDIRSQLKKNGTAFMIDNNAIHHTLSIKNFPFMSNTSRLALKIHFSVKDKERDFTDPAVDDPNAEQASNLGSDDDDTAKIRPVASWSKTVDACGATADVKKSIVKDVEWTKDVDRNFPDENTVDEKVSITFKRKILYFSFLTTCARPDIFWDPDLGIVDNSDDNAALGLLPSWAMILAVLMALYAKMW